MNGKSYLFLALGAALFLTSCKKGDTGQSGIDGAPGPAGTSANVIYSDWIDINMVPLIHVPGESADSASFTFNQVISAPKLVADILNRGTVLLYVKNSKGKVSSSEVTYGVFDEDADGPINFAPFASYMVGKIILFDRNPVDRINATGASIRYVLIPGVNASGRIATDADAATAPTIEELKKMPYDEVARLFHIQ